MSLTDPQSWNRYAYVANSPLASIDPLGLDSSKCLDVGYADSHAECGSPGVIWGGNDSGGGGGGGIDGGGGGGGDGETLGIPNWLPFPQASLLDFLPKFGGGCDFGPCGVGSGFSSPAIPWPWPAIGRGIGIALSEAGAAALNVLGVAGGMLFLQGDGSAAQRREAIEKIYKNEIKECRGLASPAARSRCYESALNRKIAREQGKGVLPPLIKW